ncbi:VOC family protein [Aestuariibacter sp. AA17]|uniref:VOC family protein n=1 Tax=Fluctibacter corallii TaxID=2984329 RepID=A0ABT3AB57_9ALTE|nr:VOC family protein [Aestuariibacter sp. AA17]MCV2885911.1 VOC family protein [Aestuariibacter sp. AA17]
MRVSGINHITITVSDLAQSMAFYCEQLGFTGRVIWDSGAYLEAGNCWLCLNVGEPKPSQDYSHIAFSVSSNDIAELVKIPSLQFWQDNTSEGASFYILDPDGHKIELHDGSLETRLQALKNAPYKGLQWL